MAGAFTHFIICDVAKRRRKSLDGALWKLLNKYSQFLFLGAASPDLPYLSFRTGNINWADVMHYEKTNSIALSAHKELKTNWPSKSSLDEVKLIWLFGYISHLVADAYDAIGELHKLDEKLQGTKIQLRIQKKIREIKTKSMNMQTLHEVEASAKLRQAMVSLDIEAPNCKKCGSKMVLRVGNDKYFWGCEKFPECWSRQSLKKEELDRLRGDENQKVKKKKSIKLLQNNDNTISLSPPPVSRAISNTRMILRSKENRTLMMRRNGVQCAM